MTDRTALTDQQLDEIETRANAATPGPWEEHQEYGSHFFAYLRGPYLRGVGTLNFGDGDDADADREFVRHAREDVDALVAEVRRLRTQLAAVHGLCDEQDQVARMLEFPTPPWIRAVRAVVQSADVDEMAAALRRDGFGPDQIATMLPAAAAAESEGAQ